MGYKSRLGGTLSNMNQPPPPKKMGKVARLKNLIMGWKRPYCIATKKSIFPQ